jgi:hypothetical protein
MGSTADGVAPEDVYETLRPKKVVARAFYKLTIKEIIVLRR